MSTSGKLEMIMQLYTSGSLCKCTKTEIVYIGEDDGRIEKIIHSKDCKASESIKELLNNFT